MTRTTNHKGYNINSPEAFLWASTGKSVQIAMSTQQTLSDLLEAFADGHHKKTELYLDVAIRLSKVARKSPAWKEDYIQAVANGKKPSKKLAHAVEVLAAQVDGTPPVIADSEAVTVYARRGAVQPGALIEGESQPCHYAPCTAHFVPTHPRMIYCPVHREPKSRRP